MVDMMQIPSKVSSHENFNTSITRKHSKGATRSLTEAALQNNTIPSWNRVVNDGKQFSWCQISEICPRSLQNDLPREGTLPPMKKQLRKWFSQSSTATPCNTAQNPIENALMKKVVAWPTNLNVEMKFNSLPRGLSRKEVGFPLANTWCYTAQQSQLNN